MTDDWRIITTEAAPLLDVTGVLLPLARLRYAHPRPEGRLRFVLLRWCDLTRRFSPTDALSVLDAELPSVDETPSMPHLTEAAVRAATLLETAQVDEAERWVTSVSAACGARALLEGRVAMQRGRLDEAHQHWEIAVVAAQTSGLPLASEVEIEALGNIARLLSARGLPADAWFTRLDQRCQELHAGFTQSAFRTLRTLQEPTARELRNERTTVAIKASMMARYAEAFLGDAAKVGPVPLHVHGMAKVHHLEPKAYLEAVTMMASLLWRQGDRQRGYETAWYGRAVGSRLFGPKIEAALTELIDLLLAPLTPERRAAFETRLRINALGSSEA
jgi:hypothetical protein